jgi:hypothetical protein
LFNNYEHLKKVNKVDRIKLDAILHEALTQLDLILGHRWKVTLRPNKKRFGDDQFIIYRTGKEAYRADCLVHTNFKDEHIARNFTQLKDNKTIVIAENILPKTRELLRKEEINYLDINGNCFIMGENPKEDLFLYLDGQKNKVYHKETYNRPFTKAGLKVVYQFLINPDLINHTYREIAERAGIALGNIKQIIDGLIEEGFLVRKNKNEFAFIKTDDLLDRWTKAYGERLKPALEIGTFRFLNPNDFMHWKDIHLDTKKTCWGGEPAANLWTNYLKPGVLTLYTEETRIELIKKYKLVPEINGNIKVYRKFWKEEKKTDNKVNPILTYADLILTTDMRCLETAHMIYEKYIQKT